MMWSVLGSGVSALCIATELVNQGESVEVIEQPDLIAASHYAGGMLAPFCESESAPDSVRELGQQAIRWWSHHIPGVKQQGSLVLAPARDHGELKRFAAMTEQYQWVDPGDIEPDLSGRFSRSLFYPSEAHLDPRAALQQLTQKLIERGVVFHTRASRGTVIDCRGIHAQPQLPALRAVRGEMAVLRTEDVSFSRPIRLLHPRFPCYLVPREHGLFMLGATMIESANRGPITARALLELLSSAYAIHPAFAEAQVIETGSGLRPAFQDNLPKIEYHNGRWFINGMYRHGFLLAPVMAMQFISRLAQSQEKTCSYC